MECKGQLRKDHLTEPLGGAKTLSALSRRGERPRQTKDPPNSHKLSVRL